MRYLHTKFHDTKELLYPKLLESGEIYPENENINAIQINVH